MRVARAAGEAQREGWCLSSGKRRQSRFEGEGGFVGGAWLVLSAHHQLLRESLPAARNGCCRVAVVPGKRCVCEIDRMIDVLRRSGKVAAQRGMALDIDVAHGRALNGAKMLATLLAWGYGAELLAADEPWAPWAWVVADCGLVFVGGVAVACGPRQVLRCCTCLWRGACGVLAWLLVLVFDHGAETLAAPAAGFYWAFGALFVGSCVVAIVPPRNVVPGQGGLRRGTSGSMRLFLTAQAVL